MNKVRIQRLDPEISLPGYIHEDDAAFDLRSAEEKTIEAGKKEVIKTGIKVAIPKNHVGLIWDRSGLAAKKDITVLGGVLDAGYREEVKIILKNLGEEPFKINKNDRIAQMIIQPYLKAEIEETKKLEETDRKGGLGHTGIK
ncbi:MAG: dUTP diphosphatase [Candidatus Woesearchaeota archaeon]